MSRVLIATVGGTPQPLIKTILEHRPVFVCFLCSQESVDKIAEIKSSVKLQSGGEGIGDFKDFKVITEDVNDVSHCYQKALECLKKIEVLDAGVEETIVDITGGTKAMSVAVALATWRYGCSFSYVGGTQRTKDGLGVVVDGSESVRVGISPWTAFAVEERRRIAELFSHYQFIAAEKIARDMAKAPYIDEVIQKLFKVVANLSQAYDLWDKFKHKESAYCMKKVIEQIENYLLVIPNQEFERLIEDVRSNFVWLQKLQDETSDFQKPAFRQVVDLIANAERRAEEGKYDDAVARLYRALEFAAQVAISEPPLMVNDAGDVPIDKIPETLREEFIKKYQGDDGKIKLGSFALFNLLAVVGHQMGISFMNEKVSLQGILTSRNQSILAHGKLPIKQSTYEKLREKLLKFLEVESELVEFPKIESF